MHPENIACLPSARIDCCVLVNNHVLDWGRAGLVETFNVLERAGIKQVGAGKDRDQGAAPAIFNIGGKGRLIVFAYGAKTSGIPGSWVATETSPGINVLPDLSIRTVDHIKESVASIKRPGDLVLLSIHWGGNWGYAISEMEREFAHKLLNDTGIDAIYGYSSHHAKGIEVYKGKLILYGCGDFLNDYEGIGGHEHRGFVLQNVSSRLYFAYGGTRSGTRNIWQGNPHYFGFHFFDGDSILPGPG